MTFSEGVLTFRISVSREEPAEPIIDYVTRLAYQYKFKVLEIKALEPSLEDVSSLLAGASTRSRGG
ncbi:hypothetical protein [Aeropyrum camini]|uniref:hypothetical protein n=1 Tax=Aeropyrum camini TaxID=229980 RepID=UPI0012E17171|nr:hypothetical protein [Aeropyrum camini]